MTTTKKLRGAPKRILLNLLRGRSWDAGIEGKTKRAQADSAIQTLIELGWVTWAPSNRRLTTVGREVAEGLQ